MKKLVSLYRDVIGRNIRKGMARVLELIEEDLAKERAFAFVLNLPTGYGKTTLSLTLGRSLGYISSSLYSRVIHIIPTRCLAEKILGKANKVGVDAYAQYMYADPSVKAPYFLCRYLVTTYDSFMLNYYKACVARIREEYGHFEVPRYAIHTGLIFMDEYHLFYPGDTIERDRRFEARAWTALLRTLKQLSRYSVPLILSTATSISYMQNEVLKILEHYFEGDIKIIELAPSDIERRHERTIEVRVADTDYSSIAEKVNIWTDVVKMKKKEDFVHFVRNKVQEEEGRKILVICNTISLAQKVYCSIKHLCKDVTLLHSKFATSDKIKNIENLEKHKVVVSTQVLEVGVDYDADLLISEIAPLVSLVQRCGRLVRNLEDREGRGELKGDFDIVLIEERINNEAKHYSGIYSLHSTLKTLDIIDYVIKKGQKIEWKLPYNVEGRISYYELAEAIYKGYKIEEDTTYDLLLKAIDENILIDKPVVSDILAELCSFMRNDLVIPVYVPIHEVSTLSDINSEIESLGVEHLIERLMPLEFPLIAKYYKKLLLTDKNGVWAIFEDSEGSVKVLSSSKLLGVIQRFKTYRCSLMDYVEYEGHGRALYLQALILNPTRYRGEIGLLMR